MTYKTNLIVEASRLRAFASDIFEFSISGTHWPCVASTPSTACCPRTRTWAPAAARKAAVASGPNSHPAPRGEAANPALFWGSPHRTDSMSDCNVEERNGKNYDQKKKRNLRYL